MGSRLPLGSLATTFPWLDRSLEPNRPMDNADDMRNKRTPAHPAGDARARRTSMPDEGALLDHVLDTLAGGLFTVDTAGIITTWNRGMEELTGYAASEALGMSCSVLSGNTCFMGPLGTGPMRCALFAGGEVRGKTCSVRHRDGRTLAVLKHARLMRDPEGEVIGGIEAVSDITGMVALREEVARLKRDAARGKGECPIIGRHPRMRALFDMIDAAAASTASVLVLGDTGTGKELVAEAIHRASTRSQGPFVRVACGALSESVLESELFGHVRGAFTGAVATRHGRFEAANGGTIFLDEIGDISPNVQQKLLRVLQEREFERVGDNRAIRVDIRVVAATNKDLLQLVGEDRFRADLYYRLAVIPVHVPPLRERISDIPPLVEAFIDRMNRTGEHHISGIEPDALDRLMEHSWPGNVRELEHAIEYAAAVSGAPILRLEHLPALIREFDSPQARKGGRPAQVTRETVLAALCETGGNRTRAAAALGVSRVTMWKWMRKYEIDVPSTRSRSR